MLFVEEQEKQEKKFWSLLKYWTIWIIALKILRDQSLSFLFQFDQNMKD